MKQSEKDKLTKKQLAILQFIWKFYEEEDRLPSCKEIAVEFEFYSVNSAHAHLVALEKKGFIEKRAEGGKKWYRFTKTTARKRKPKKKK